MARTKFGQLKVELQHGWTVQEGDDQVLNGQAQYICDEGSVGALPRFGQPFEKDRRLYVIDRQNQKMKNGRISCQLTLMGLAADPTRFILQWPGASGQDPIETHPDFTQFGTAGNGAKFGSEGEFLAFTDSSNRKFGVRSYVVPNPTVYLSYWTFQKPKLSKEGRIISKIPNLVKPKQVKNWLLLGLPFREIGGFMYQVTAQLLGSGEDGFDTDIYGAPTTLF